MNDQDQFGRAITITLVALVLIGGAFVLVFGLFVFGPH